MKGLPAAAGGMRLRNLMFPADANLLPGRYYLKKYCRVLLRPREGL